jgi:hypothetical protein
LPVLTRTAGGAGVASFCERRIIRRTMIDLVRWGREPFPI